VRFVIQIRFDVARVIGGALVRHIKPQDFLGAGGQELIAPKAAQPVGSLILREQVGTLFQHQHAFALTRELVRNRRTAGTAADDDQIILALHHPTFLAQPT
jgi:hypothetical protein